MNRLSLVDFDRTLFDTSRFVDQLVLTLHQELGINSAKFRDGVKRRSDGESYALFDHLAEEYPEFSLPALKLMLHNKLRLQGFLFQDAYAFLQDAKTRGDVVIITTGNQAYQEFKLSFCPSLAEFKRQIVPINKGDWLEDLWNVDDSAQPKPGGTLRFRGKNYDEVRLVDDNPAVFEGKLRARPILNLVQIVRPGSKYPVTPLSYVREVRSLTDIHR